MHTIAVFRIINVTMVHFMDIVCIHFCLVLNMVPAGGQKAFPLMIDVSYVYSSNACVGANCALVAARFDPCDQRPTAVQATHLKPDATQKSISILGNLVTEFGGHSISNSGERMLGGSSADAQVVTNAGPNRRLFLPEGLLDRSEVPSYLTGEIPGE